MFSLGGCTKFLKLGNEGLVWVHIGSSFQWESTRDLEFMDSGGHQDFIDVPSARGGPWGTALGRGWGRGWLLGRDWGRCWLTCFVFGKQVCLGLGLGVEPGLGWWTAKFLIVTLKSLHQFCLLMDVELDMGHVIFIGNLKVVMEFLEFSSCIMNSSQCSHKLSLVGSICLRLG
jgi:hypothetical protein